MAAAFRSVRAGTSMTTAEPVGTVADDIVLGVATCEDADATLTAATGWTIITQSSTLTAPDLNGAFAWTRRGGSPTATNWSWSGGAAQRISLITYSGCKTTGSPINQFSLGSWTTTTAAAAAITTTVDNCMILGLIGVYDWGAASSANFNNERLDTGEAHCMFDDDLLTPAGLTPTLTATVGGDGYMCLLALAPAGGAVLLGAPPYIVGQGAAVQRSYSW